MAAQTALVVFDGALTPVLHTLEPMGTSRDKIDGYVAEWREMIATLTDELQVGVKSQVQTLKSGVKRVSLVVRIPEAELVSGANAQGYTAAPKVALQNTLVITGYYAPRSTIVSNRRLRQLGCNLLGGITTTVAPVATGAVPMLFDSGTPPS